MGAPKINPSPSPLTAFGYSRINNVLRVDLIMNKHFRITLNILLVKHQNVRYAETI